MGIRNYLIERGVYIVKQNKKYSLNKVLTDVAKKKSLINK